MFVDRANLHKHSFHDKKILQKIENNAVYSAIDEVQGVKSDTNDTGLGQLQD